jgi:hypothetical protein
MRGASKRPALQEAERRAVRLKWVKHAADGDSALEDAESLALKSFELVPLPAASLEPLPDPELAIAAASLLASIVAAGTQRLASPPLVVTADVPLAWAASALGGTRNVLQPITAQQPRA